MACTPYCDEDGIYIYNDVNSDAEASSPIRNAPTIRNIESIVRLQHIYVQKLFLKFIEALALGKYWFAQTAARCPWQPAERRLVCVAV